MAKYTVENFILGEDPKITAVLDSNLSLTDTVTITIEDPGGNTLIDEASMTRVQNNVFTYIFSTTDASLEGVYEATITVTTGVNKDMDRIYFQFGE